MTASLDTNVLLRFAMKDVPDQFTRARRLLAEPGVQYVVSVAAWVELAFVLEHYYELDRSAVVDVIATLRHIDAIVTSDGIVESACLAYEQHPKLSFADCCLAAEASHVGALPLYTFDEKLARQHIATQLVP